MATITENQRRNILDAFGEDVLCWCDEQAAGWVIERLADTRVHPQMKIPENRAFASTPLGRDLIRDAKAWASMRFPPVAI